MQDAAGRDAKRVEWRAGSVVSDVAWHPDGKLLATAGNDGVKLWRIDGAKATEAPGGTKEAATALAFTPDGKELLVALGGASPKVVRLTVP